VKRTDGGTEWLVYGLIGRQCLTIITGPYKGGKSTLVCALVRALLTREPVIGLSSREAKRVRWFTEESPGSMRQKLRQWGLADKRLLVVYRGQAPATTWDTLLAFIERSAVRDEVIIIDTLAVHVSNQPGAENSTDLMTASLEAARGVAQRKRIAFTFVHHDNKGGRMRGSEAIGASVDVIGHVRLPQGSPYDKDAAVRHWTAESRVDETPRSLYLRLTRPADDVPYYDVLPDPDAEAGKVAVAEVEEPTGPTGRARDILDVLATAGTPVDISVLASTIAVHRTSLYGPIKALVAEGLVIRSGAGGKADPVRYTLLHNNTKETDNGTQ